MEELIKKLETAAWPAYNRIIRYLLYRAESNRYYELIKKKYRRMYNICKGRSSSPGEQTNTLTSHFPKELPYIPDIYYQDVYKFLREEEGILGSLEEWNFLDKSLWAHHWIKMKTLDDLLDSGGHLHFWMPHPLHPPAAYLDKLGVSPNRKSLHPYTWTSWVPKRLSETMLTFDVMEVFERVDPYYNAPFEILFKSAPSETLYSISIKQLERFLLQKLEACSRGYTRFERGFDVHIRRDTLTQDLTKIIIDITYVHWFLSWDFQPLP